jgi:hypothetical protein
MEKNTLLGGIMSEVLRQSRPEEMDKAEEADEDT